MTTISDYTPTLPLVNAIDAIEFEMRSTVVHLCDPIVVNASDYVDAVVCKNFKNSYSNAVRGLGHLHPSEYNITLIDGDMAVVPCTHRASVIITDLCRERPEIFVTHKVKRVNR